MPPRLPCYSSPMTKMNSKTRNALTAAQSAKLQAIETEVAGNGSGNTMSARAGVRGAIIVTEREKDGTQAHVTIHQNGNTTY